MHLPMHAPTDATAIPVQAGDTASGCGRNGEDGKGDRTADICKNNVEVHAQVAFRQSQILLPRSCAGRVFTDDAQANELSTGFGAGSME